MRVGVKMGALNGGIECHHYFQKIRFSLWYWSDRVQGSTLPHKVTGVQEVALEVLLAEGGEEAVQEEFRRETGEVVEVEEVEEEPQNKVGQTLLSSSSLRTREDTAKEGSTTATVKMRTSLASLKGEYLHI